MMRVRPLIIILVILLVILQYELWFEPTGLVNLFKLRHTVADQAAQNKLLEERNQALAERVDALKQGNGAVETQARQDLGMVKNDEVYYQVIENDKKN
jgi:cell division protein FtsB